MSGFNLNKCSHLDDQLFTKVSSIRVMDKDGNIFTPWHRWHSQARSFLENERSGDMFTYWSNDVTLTKNFTVDKVTDLPIEIARLKCSGLITNEQFENIVNMIKSKDIENLAIAVEAIKLYRKKRLKIGKQQKNRR